jgi:general secretion pathway protein E
LKGAEKALSKPDAVIFVAGPTGSAKSTTFGAFLRHVYAQIIRLITVEEPVECETAGAILHQDPGTIMLGKIRDSETGDIAIRAAVTGYLVLSHLHTNDVVGSRIHLKEIGRDRYIIVSAIEMGIAQRFVRRLCPHCAQESPKLNTPDELEKFHLLFNASELLVNMTLMEPVGCEHCDGIGFRGRMAIFEILSMSERVHEAIVVNGPESEIRSIVTADGMTFLAQDAFVRGCRGLTTVDEAIQLIPEFRLIARTAA